MVTAPVRIAELDGMSVLARIRGLRPALTPTEGRLADFLLADPARTAALTITDLARSTGTSTTTVTRLCRSVGVAGYPELRLALANAVGHAQTRGWSEGVDGDISPSDSLDQLLTKLVAVDTRALEATAAQLDLTAVERSVDALASARRIDIYAVGGSAAMAQTLHLRLHEFGRPAFLWTDVHGALTSAALLGRDDVAVAISHSGETVEVVEPLAVARANGATAIGLTNFPRSPVAQEADFLLATAAEEGLFRTGGRAGRQAQLLVLDCLCIALIQRRYRSPEGAKAIEDAAAAMARALDRHRLRGRTPPRG